MSFKKVNCLVAVARIGILSSLVLPLLTFAQDFPDAIGTSPLPPGRIDRLISDPTVEVVAPEFSPTGLEMSYCARDGRVHIMAMNATGGLLDPTGASDIILGECDFFTNGPEWGFTADELVLAWTVPKDSQGNAQLAVATRPVESADWTELNPLPGSSGKQTPYPIRSSISRRPWLLYSSGDSIKAGMIYNISNGRSLATNNPYPTWKPDSYEVATVYPETGEIISMNVVTGASRLASGMTAAWRFNPWLWTAPETHAEAAFVFNLTSGCIEFYHQTGEMAQPDRELCGTDFGEGAVIVTPEPFILRGRSYVSFLVESRSETGIGKSDIYVAGAVDFAGEESYLERTSSDQMRLRRDPEPVVNWRRAYIYYSSVSQQEGEYGVWQTLVKGRPPFQVATE